MDLEPLAQVGVMVEVSMRYQKATHGVPLRMTLSSGASLDPVERNCRTSKYRRMALTDWYTAEPSEIDKDSAYGLLGDGYYSPSCATCNKDVALAPDFAQMSPWRECAGPR
jgi:hypothetical protein